MILGKRIGARRLAAFGTVLAGVIAFAFLVTSQLNSTSASGGGSEMRLVLLNGGSCDGSVCDVAVSSEFLLGIEVVTAPAARQDVHEGGYVQLQTFISYEPTLTQNFASTTLDELVWPDVDPATALRQFDPDFAWVNHAGLTAILPPAPVSNYTGIVVELSFTCSDTESTTEVRLRPEGDPTLPEGKRPFGALFLEPDGLTQNIPKLNSLTIHCNPGLATPTEAPPTETSTPTVPPTPTATPCDGPCPTATSEVPPTDTPTITPSATPALTTATPTATPTPTPTPLRRPCGDVNGDGSVSSLDALWILWFELHMVPFLPFADDLDGDTVTGPLDALLILQIEANLYVCGLPFG